jgi:hypothetical protein
MAGSRLVIGCGAFRLRGPDLPVVMCLAFLGCTCVALCLCFVEVGCGGVIVAGSFRLRALFALGVGISLETSSSSCVDDDAVDGDGDDGGGASAGRMLLLHLSSFVEALYLGLLVWQIPQDSSWGVLRA